MIKLPFVSRKKFDIFRSLVTEYADKVFKLERRIWELELAARSCEERGHE